MPQNVDAEAGVIYEEVIEEISEIVVITDPGGIISYANSSFYNITCFDPATVIGANVFKFFELPFDSKPGRSILRKIGRGEQWIGYLLVCQREGDFLELHTTIKPSERLPNGEKQLILVGQDVTREKHLQKQLNEIQRLESLGTLADGIAHHFNNILASMMGQAELVIALLEERKDLKGCLRQILAAGERGKKFVSQLSTFCQTGGRDRYIPVRINPILEEAIGFIQKVGLKDVTVEKSISDDEITVLANPAELNQVFLNLLTNSLQAMKRQSGNLVIVLRERKAPFAATGVEENTVSFPCAEVLIRDDGNGIPDSIKHRVFEPYFTTRNLAESSGMGLAVAHGIVKRHGGTISFESFDGKGTTFRIQLPLLDSAIPESTESNLGELQGMQEHILLVDDEDFVLEAGKDLLTDIGYRVTATSKAEKAIQLIERNPESFDLLITDQTMPNISGLELAKRVRSQEKSLPIVLCSGINDDIVRDELAKLGIAGFLPKPCSLYDMASAIREALLPASKREGPSEEK